MKKKVLFVAAATLSHAATIVAQLPAPSPPTPNPTGDAKAEKASHTKAAKAKADKGSSSTELETFHYQPPADFSGDYQHCTDSVVQQVSVGPSDSFLICYDEILYKKPFTFTKLDEFGGYLVSATTPPIGNMAPITSNFTGIAEGSNLKMTSYGQHTYEDSD